MILHDSNTSIYPYIYDGEFAEINMCGLVCVRSTNVLEANVSTEGWESAVPEACRCLSLSVLAEITFYFFTEESRVWLEFI